MNTWQPTGFSAGEFARMQQDAERRVEEMRRRARRAPGNRNTPTPRRCRPSSRGGDHPASGGGTGLAFAVVGFVVSI